MSELDEKLCTRARLDRAGASEGAPKDPSEEDLTQLGAEVRGGLALVAADLDEALHVDLQEVEVVARRAVRQVALDLQQLRVGQLAVDVPVEVLQTVATVHAPSSPAWTMPDSCA